jgi:hypothetical protein
MTHTSTDTVAATLVPHSQRLAFLPQRFGRLHRRVEDATYNHLRSLSTDYQGGYWEFYALSNGGAFIAPSQGEYRIVSPNGYAGTLSPIPTGIVATLFALSHLSFGFEDPILADQFHALREFAVEHEDARAILAAID